MRFYDDLIDATPFKTAQYEYQLDFKSLLSKTYSSYENMKVYEKSLPKNENKIRDILVDKYLSKELPSYDFRKEEKNNSGRVDIYVIDKYDDSEPNYIIECKILDNKNLNGEQGKNGLYIKEGILRLLREKYIIENSYYTNAMIGFIVDDLNIKKNINSINTLSQNILNNLVNIVEEIIMEEKHIYKSIYKTYNNKKFIIYHLMMDFSKNIE